MKSDYPLETAQKSASENDLEGWAHRYLLSEGGNKPFSDGLYKEKRYWRGPMLFPMGSLTRVCGPEEGMPYRYPDRAPWDAYINKLINEFSELELYPPLIVSYVDGKFIIDDGNHRFYAFEQLGIEAVWVILWYPDKAHYDAHARRDFVDIPDG